MAREQAPPRRSRQRRPRCVREDPARPRGGRFYQFRDSAGPFYQRALSCRPREGREGGAATSEIQSEAAGIAEASGMPATISGAPPPVKPQPQVRLDARDRPSPRRDECPRRSRRARGLPPAASHAPAAENFQAPRVVRGRSVPGLRARHSSLAGRAVNGSAPRVLKNGTSVGVGRRSRGARRSDAFSPGPRVGPLSSDLPRRTTPSAGRVRWGRARTAPTLPRGRDPEGSSLVRAEQVRSATHRRPTTEGW